MPSPGYDFAGYASKNNVRCTDGTIIREGCFHDMDGKTVPLVWNHQHNNVGEVLGHAEFEERPDGLYAYAYCNDTPAGQNAKELVNNGDVNAFSVWANNLRRKGNDILHGIVRELSLVLAGADREAIIDTVIAHGEETDDEAEIAFLGGYGEFICHAGDSNTNGEKETKDMNTDDNKEVKETNGGDDKTVEDVLKTFNKEQRDVLNYFVGLALDEKNGKGEKKKDEIEHADDPEPEDESDDKDKTVADVLKTFNKEQKDVLNYLVGMALKEGGNKSNSKEETEMKHNAFEDYGNAAVTTDDYISHDDLEQLKKAAKQIGGGSLKEAWKAALENGEILAHADTPSQYGIMSVTSSYGDTGGADDYLFPDARMIGTTPDFISRNMDWVDVVLNGVHRTPFARVKSIHADITEDEARARGYIKGKYKKEEVFGLLKRVTYPTLVYKKQRMDKQDIDNITEFDVIVWLKGEMQIMLREEVARAILIGDGREESDEDRISQESIRPVYNDVDLYTIKYPIEISSTATDEEKAHALLEAQLRARKEYRGSGNPIFFTTYDELTNCLLLENGIGERMYKSEAEVATAMRVSRVQVVEPMVGLEIEIATDSGSTKYPVAGIDVNLSDYNVGTNGGARTDFFDDFDLNYNQQIMLYETQLSGAMSKPLSAITFYYKTV